MSTKKKHEKGQKKKILTREEYLGLLKRVTRTVPKPTDQEKSKQRND